MNPSGPSSLCLFAVVSAEHARAIKAAGLRVVSNGSLLAVVGSAPVQTAPINQALALSHHRVVERVFRRCSGVIPFRAGVLMPSPVAVSRFLLVNEHGLGEVLRRVTDRVEMGLKVKWPSAVDGSACAEPALLGAVRALCRAPTDQRERSQGSVLDGAYLIARTDVPMFWEALERIRAERPEVAILGSGPWAPYSFCDVALLPAPKGKEAARAAD